MRNFLQGYLEHDGLAFSRAEFEENLNGKLRNPRAGFSGFSLGIGNIPSPEFRAVCPQEAGPFLAL